MTHRTLRNSLVIGLIAVALIAGAFQLETRWRQPDTVRAQTDDDDDDLSGGALAVLLLAVGQGQKLRLSVGTAPGRREVPYFWFFTLHNTRNEVIFRSERIEVPSGEWRFSEVPREAFTITGEPAQVKVQVFVDVPRGRRPSDFTGSAAVLNQATGESSTYTNFTFK
jgi:hypothetical protein